MAVAGSYVYWVNSAYGSVIGTVKKAPVDGGRVITLATGGQDATSVTVDGTNVYWIDNENDTDFGVGMVNKVPIGGGKSATLAFRQDSSTSVAVNGTHVYWVNEDYDGTVKRVPIGGGRVTILARGQNSPASLAVGP